jgi:UMF1 family MFS transporter
MSQRPASPPVQKREIFGWAMYDFANSSYTTVVITVIYGSFFTAHIVPEGGPRDTLWAAAIVAATLLAMVLSPLVGALCDYSGMKKRYLGYASLTCSLGTMALALAQPGQVWLAFVLLVISNTGFMLGESFCGSFLPELATPKNMGVISGLGWGLGYFGGLASLIGTQLIISASEADALTRYQDQNRASMIFVGAFFLLSALPTFLLVKKRDWPAPGFEGASFGRLMRKGWDELRDSAALARRYKVLFHFLMVFAVYMAGLEVVIKFIGIYAKQEVKLTQGDLVWMFLIIQISAAAGAVGFGFLERRLGAKPTLLLTLVGWLLASLTIIFLPNISELLGVSQRNLFFGIALVAGSGIGSVQSSSRTVVGLLSPPERSAQMFGFWGMFSRLAIILGMSFGPVADAIGSRRLALGLVSAFFVIGGLLLTRVPIERGIREAHGDR